MSNPRAPITENSDAARDAAVDTLIENIFGVDEPDDIVSSPPLSTADLASPQPSRVATGAGPVQGRTPVPFGARVGSLVGAPMTAEQRLAAERRSKATFIFRKIHYHAFLDIMVKEIDEAWTRAYMIASAAMDLEVIDLGMVEEYSASVETDRIRQWTDAAQEARSWNIADCNSIQPPVRVVEAVARGTAIIRNEATHPSTGSGARASSPVDLSTSQMERDSVGTIRPAASSASAMAASSTSSISLIPSVIQTDDIVRLQLWNQQNLRSFYDFCWRRSRTEAEAARFIPSLYMTEEMIAESRLYLMASCLDEYVEGFYSDVTVTLKALKEILRQQFPGASLHSESSDVIEKRNDKLLPVLRKYTPVQPFLQWPHAWNRFFTELTPTEIAILDTPSNIASFLRLGREGPGGSKSLSRLLTSVETTLRERPRPTFKDYCEELLAESGRFHKKVEPLLKEGFTYAPVANSITQGARTEYRLKQRSGLLPDKIFKKEDRPQETPQRIYSCYRCGWNGHNASQCTNINPDVNSQKVPFAESEMGKQWQARGVQQVPANVRLDGSLTNPAAKLSKADNNILVRVRQYNDRRTAQGGEPPAASAQTMLPSTNNRSQPRGQPPHKRQRLGPQPPSECHWKSTLAAFTGPELPASVINCSIIIHDQSNTFSCLLDTGSFQNNFASPEVREWMKNLGQEPQRKGGHFCSVCSPISQTCTDCSDSSCVIVEYLNESANVNERCPVTLFFPSTWHSNSYDIIIGLHTLKQHNILAKLIKRFSSDYHEQGGVGPVQPFLLPKVNTRSPNLLSAMEVTMSAELRSEPLIPIDSEDITGGLGFREPALSWDPDPQHVSSSDIPTKVHGTVTFIKKCNALLREFREVFSRTIDSTPSRVAPMTLEVDYTKWQRPANHLPFRLQTALKEAEIKRQVEKMLEFGVIRPSQQPYYSQVHLVPKPNGKWRFTIDFRNLNSCCTQAGWPLPHIATMLQRIGTRRPTHFAKFDMTDGYHQFPLAEEAKKATAFITPIGLFEFNRVVMGLSGSGSNFQERMSMEVLVGLLYMICEVYLDDILLYACNEDELLNNLRSLLTRFRDHHILLNPDKVEIGLPQLEFVGHLLDAEGIHMTESKLDSIRDFPQPQLKRELKAFLGLANYFRDHVRNHSILAHPLQGILHGYSAKDRNHKIVWSTELANAFDNLKQVISDCQKLYFLDDTSPIHLQTDASDYGIGGYLFQITPEGVRPIMFISKSLDKTQCRWSTPEKEMYAIWYSLQKMDHLLRDRRFYLQTDHENLTRNKVTGSPKVIRWQLDIQQYLYTISHIKGENNMVADGFSRLCKREDPEYCAALDIFGDTPQELLLATPDYSRSIDHLAALEEAEATTPGKIPNKQYRLIAAVHNHVAGHHGVMRTISKLTRQGQQWSHMREHVRNFIRKCPACQLLSHIKTSIHTLPFTTSAPAPMTVVSVDAIGPLPEDAAGNTYVLTVIDNFTRYTELYAIANVTAEATVPALIDFIGRYGCPTIIKSDNGSQFVNDLIENLIRIIGTDHIRTLAYSKEENSIVERANKEVLRHLRAFTFAIGTNTDWSLRLPLVARILNSTVHDSIGVSPASLLFGNLVNLDRGIFLPLEAIEEDRELPLSTWSQTMLKEQERLLAIAEQRQRFINDKHMSHIPDEITSYPVNSLVLSNYPDGPLGMRPPTKLHTNLRGPFRVLSNVGGVYTLYDFVTQKEFQTHIKHLHPYNDDPRNPTPEAVARKVQGEFLVHSIVGHHGNPQRKSEMDFRVRWDGYTEADDQWLPWRSLRNNPKLHEYLRANGLAKLVPKEHRPLPV